MGRDIPTIMLCHYTYVYSPNYNYTTIHYRLIARIHTMPRNATQSTMVTIGTAPEGLTVRKRTNDKGTNDPTSINAAVELYGRLYPIGKGLPFRVRVPVSPEFPTGVKIILRAFSKKQLMAMIATVRKENPGNTLPVIYNHTAGILGMVDEFTFEDDWLCIKASLFGPNVAGNRVTEARTKLKEGTIKSLSLGITATGIMGNGPETFAMHEVTVCDTSFFEGSDISYAKCAHTALHEMPISNPAEHTVTFDPQHPTMDSEPAPTAIDAAAAPPAAAEPAAEPVAEPAAESAAEPAPQNDPSLDGIDPQTLKLLAESQEQLKIATKDNAEIATKDNAETTADIQKADEAAVGEKRDRDNARIDELTDQLEHETAAHAKTTETLNRVRENSDRTSNALAGVVENQTAQLKAYQKTLAATTARLHANASATRAAATATAAGQKQRAAPKMATGQKKMSAAAAAAAAGEENYALGRASQNPGVDVYQDDGSLVGEPSSKRQKRVQLTNSQQEWSDRWVAQNCPSRRDLLDNPPDTLSDGDKAFLALHDRIAMTK